MKLEELENTALREWVQECANLCKPDKIVLCDGSEEEKKKLTKEAFSNGELISLNQEILPGCVYHRTAISDVARTEDLTFICTNLKGCRSYQQLDEP